MFTRSLSAQKLSWERTALLLIFLAEIAGLIQWGWKNNFITYRQDFGETYVAYKQSLSILGNFSHYGMLHVETDAAGIHKVYTHNVNLGTEYFTVLRLLGVRRFREFAILVLPIFILGLFLAYRAIRSITGSVAIGIVFLGLMSLDFANVGAFAFNALRAWHYVGLFSCVWAISIISRRAAGRRLVAGVALLAAGAFISFGCGYDFFVIVVMITFFQLLFFSSWRWLGRIGGLTVLCFLLPFVLRQIEIIYWLGRRIWYVDFYTTVAIKVPFASRFISIPSIAEIDAMYDRAGLMRPPAYPTNSWAGIWQTVDPLVRLAVIPNYGLLGCLLVVACALFALIRLSLLRRETSSARAGRLIAAYLAGAVLGLLVFAPFSFHVYMKHDFPLIAALVHLAEATCLAGLIGAALLSYRTRHWIKAGVVSGLALVVAANALTVQLENAVHSKELDLRWITKMGLDRPDGPIPHESIIAAAALPPEADPLSRTGMKIRVVAADQAPWILAKAANLLVKDPLVDPIQGIGLSTTLIYSPGDGWCNLDAREPDLSHRDWLVAWWHRLTERNDLSQELSDSRLYNILLPKGATCSGDTIHLQYSLYLPRDTIDRVSVSEPQLIVRDAAGNVHNFHNLIWSMRRREPGGSTSLIYNSKFQILDIFFRAPRELLGSPGATLTMHAVIQVNTIAVESAEVAIRYSAMAPRNQITPILPEPTTQEFIAAFGMYRLLDQSKVGVGYAILAPR